MKYRPEIDGLRALAVLPVIFYHAGFGGFSGGYVGVDIFFVISGYLITTLIFTDLEEGTFSLARFYERRIRRIHPALYLVLLCSIPFAFFLMVPFELKNFAKSLVSVIFFSSNFLFWKESSYFDPATGLKPLLHTWSLAIEEQFYIFFPLLLLSLRRLSKRALFLLFGIGALCSLGLAQWAIQRSYVVINFFLLPTRAWELLMGAMVATALYKKELGPGKNHQLVSLAGILAIAASIVLFSDSTPFPGVYALLPTLGAVFVIYCARKGTLAYRLLTTPVALRIGLASYSAYLWHQPLFAFARLAAQPARPSVLMYGALIAMTLVLAELSLRLLELPFRARNFGSRKSIFFGAAGTSIFFLAVAMPALKTEGFLSRFPERDRKILSMNPVEMGRYTEREFKRLEAGEFSPKSGNRKKLLVIGDSYAQDFVNMAFENHYLGNLEVVTYAVAARCPKYVGQENVAGFYRETGTYYDEAYCSRFSNLAGSLKLAKDADIIVLAANWQPWEARHIQETLSHFPGGPGKTVLVLGSKNFGQPAILKYLSLNPAERAALKNPMAERQVLSNQYLRASLPPGQYIDFQMLFCGEKDFCRVFTSQEEPIAFDDGHFTPEGARFAGEIIFRHPSLAGLR